MEQAQTLTLQDALPLWADIVAADPSRADIWANLVLGHAMLNEPQQALTLCRRALQLHATHIELLRHEANLCNRLQDWDASAAAFQKILALAPNDMKAWTNLGLTQKMAGKFEEAEDCYRRASLATDLAIAAQAQFNLGHLLLAQQKWREGFAAYEGRLRKPDAPVCPWDLPLWRDDLAAGSRVLLWNDQGLGDAIMFMRFAKDLSERGYRLFLFGQKSLKALAELAPFIEGAFDPMDDPQPMDACLPLCSLSHALGVTSIDEWGAPYLRSSRPSVFDFPVAAPALRVGLVWGGNPAHVKDDTRSMKLMQFAPLFALPAIEWYSLQLGRDAEKTSVPFAAQLQDLSPLLTDFAATASVMAQLDLVISVDTAPAHLAGAMGIPVWILLAANNGDWRWGMHGEYSAWYPRARLFRQTTSGDWASVIQEVQQRLLEYERPEV